MFTHHRLLIVFLFIYYAIIAKLYISRVASFGCFDDCSYFMVAYFMEKGKMLYSDIFFNHQMLAVYISDFIQNFTNPQTIYHLVLYHRLVVLAFSFVMGFLILYRFRLAGLGFILIFEISKYYVFGNRFLPEALIIYPLVYLFGLSWEKILGNKVNRFDYILTGVFSWFIIFMREPYVLLALILFLLIIFEKKLSRIKILPIALFLVLSLLTIVSVSVKDYFFNVVTVNAATVAKTEIQSNNILGVGFLKIFFYPVYIFISNQWNIFRVFLIGLSAIFLFLCFYFAVHLKKIKLIIFIFLLLGIANIRYVEPGTIYYEAFHMIQWYGFFIFSIFLMLAFLYKIRNNLGYVVAFVLFVLFVNFIFSKESYIWDKIDRSEEFVTNYGAYLSNGEVIRLLAKPKDTMFVDRWDDMIYWQAKLDSSYKYSWYTGIMPGFKQYDSARIDMFRNNPPDFYYGFCPGKTTKSIILPDFRKDDYRQLYFSGKPTCLYIKKTKIPEISNEQWGKIAQFEYYLPDVN